ncbi:MAG: eukaryotic-like serine/threonine-protein kinase [Thermoanaerobaculia bacterium]|jgi:serine/threonine protein kinase/tetratricopeptide (TPR) repeat protein|nr:eukaryotic-like serine/threonine-protein kinase [Thermoanaerobaculia bacterium]
MTDTPRPASENDTEMQDDRFWEQVREIFQSAVEKPAADRADFVKDACGSDDDLRDEVESLLASHDLAGGFIEPAAPVRSFAPGNVIAGRYRIIRLLGSGGMGEVFEAEDEELHGRVALKIIRPEIASNPRILLRFKREIQLARRVTHPSVCRIYDVSHHLTQSGAGIADRRIMFVSMELLHGETLSERLRRDGRLSTTEALPIVRQLAAGLAAAHEASIIHRDLKSANVMLVPSPAGQPPRVVITDFGLAHQTDSEANEELPHLTDTGVLIGTPHYMAPEQIEAGVISPATDIYALGVVMYELVTGRLPFSGTTPISVAVNRLSASAPSPRMLVPDLDPRWEAVILRCLQRDPAQRFQNASEVSAALEPSAPLPRMPKAASARGRRSISWLLVPALLIAAPFVFEGWKKLHEPTAAPLASHTKPATDLAAITPRRAVAVLGFRNLSQRQDAAWLSNAFSELLTNELSAGETLRLASGEQVERMKSDLGVSAADAVPPSALPRVRTQLGTDMVVDGSYLAVGDQIRIDVRLQNVASGETVSTVSETGTAAGLLDLVSRTGSRLRNELGAAQLSQAEQAGLRASHPQDAEATRLYVEGLAHLRHFDSLGARPLFEQAIAREPAYPMTHSALAEALWNLGYESQASQAAEKAQDLSTALGREERLTIEARSDVMHKQWDKGIEIYRSLFTFYPDELSYGIRLGLTQNAAGKAKDALETVKKMRQLPPPLRDDVGIDLVEVDAYRGIADPKAEMAAAQRAEAKGAAAGMRSVVARAKGNHAYALRDLGKVDESVALLGETIKIYEAIGDRTNEARAMTNLGTSLWQRGDLKAARAMFEKALAEHRQSGHMTFIARTLNNLGNVEYGMGDVQKAEQTFREALRIEQQMNFITTMGPTLSNLGAMRQIQGDLDDAGRFYMQAIDVSRKTDNQTGELLGVVNFAEVQRFRGHFAEARRYYDTGLALSRKISNKQEESYTLASMGELALEQGQLTEARQRHQAAFDIRKASNEKLAMAQSQVFLANLSIEEGKPQDAVALLREAIEAFRKEQATEDEAGAHETLARAMLAQKNVSEAGAEIAIARKLALTLKNVMLASAIEVTESRQVSASGRYDEADARARASLAAAKSSQLAMQQLDARLAGAENKARRGRAAEATADKKNIRAEAEKIGLVLIAKKAA